MSAIVIVFPVAPARRFTADWTEQYLREEMARMAEAVRPPPRTRPLLAARREADSWRRTLDAKAIPLFGAAP